MKILYIAKHGPHDNQDEDAISYALEQLGHTVTRVEEAVRNRPMGFSLRATEKGHDFVLFHKYDNLYELAQFSIPRVFWFFDVIKTPDSSLVARCTDRQLWLNRILPHCLLGFLTDGDWVAQDSTGKLRHLMQGADERVIGPGTPNPGGPDIIFTGMVRHGQKRADHVLSLKNRYGPRFMVFGDSGPRFRCHGRKLADLLCSAKIVLAPNGPSTDRYWSNRVYLTCGFGGFLLHPYCEQLSSQYQDGEEIVYYRGQEDCFAKIDHYLGRYEERKRIADRGYERTVKEHLYRHRVKELVEQVRVRL